MVGAAVAAAAAMLAAALPGPLAGAAPAADSLIDPTQPPPGFTLPPVPGEPNRGTARPEPEQVHLQMIARSGNARLAVINGRSVHAGDQLALPGRNLRIVDIADAWVDLLDDGHQQRLELVPHPGLAPACPAGTPSGSGCRAVPPGVSP